MPSDTAQERATEAPAHPSVAPAGAGSPTKNVPLDQIESAVRSIRYGYVQIVIQDGVVVQIDKTEKQRLQRGAA